MLEHLAVINHFVGFLSWEMCRLQKLRDLFTSLNTQSRDLYLAVNSDQRKVRINSKGQRVPLVLDKMIGQSSSL